MISCFAWKRLLIPGDFFFTSKIMILRYKPCLQGNSSLGLGSSAGKVKKSESFDAAKTEIQEKMIVVYEILNIIMTFIKPVLASNQIIMNVSWLLCIYACFRKILSLDLLLFNTSIHPETQFHTCNGEHFKITQNCFLSRKMKQLRSKWNNTYLTSFTFL